MSDTDPRQVWSEFLDACRRRIEKMRGQPTELRERIATPMSYDTGRAPGNPRLQGLLTLASLAGLLLGGLATLITVFFTTGPVFLTLLGITLVSLLYVIWENLRDRRLSEPWFRDSQVTTGCLLVANDGLYEPGGRTLPGGMLVTFDEELRSDPGRLRELAEEFMAACNSGSEAPTELREAIAFLDDDIIEAPAFTRFQLPRSFTGNDQTYLVSLGMEQGSMPKGHLDRELWPVFGRPDKNEPVVILHHELWYRAGAPVESIAGAPSA